MAAKESGYTVSDLEALTGISRRTIHFYVKEGVIAAPEGSGGGARYGEKHLLRLQLTRELQRSHLKLSGIREAMERLSIEEMRAMAQKAGSPTKAWDRKSLEQWLATRGSRSAGGPPSYGESWQRIRVAEGLELLLRSDLVGHYQSLVADLTGRTRRRQSAAEDMEED